MSSYPNNASELKTRLNKFLGPSKAIYYRIHPNFYTEYRGVDDDGAASDLAIGAAFFAVELADKAECSTCSASKLIKNEKSFQASFVLNLKSGKADRTTTISISVDIKGPLFTISTSEAGFSHDDTGVVLRDQGIISLSPKRQETPSREPRDLDYPYEGIQVQT